MYIYLNDGSPSTFFHFIFLIFDVSFEKIKNCSRDCFFFLSDVSKATKIQITIFDVYKHMPPCKYIGFVTINE